MSTRNHTKRRAEALQALAAAAEHGLTWSELAARLDTHHGPASGVLSNLHKSGQIARLVQTRDRSKVYVLPQYIDGRAHTPPTPNPRDPWFEEALPILATLRCPTHKHSDPWCPECQRADKTIALIRRYQREVQAQ